MLLYGRGKAVPLDAYPAKAERASLPAFPLHGNDIAVYFGCMDTYLSPFAFSIILCKRAVLLAFWQGNKDGMRQGFVLE